MIYSHLPFPCSLLLIIPEYIFWGHLYLTSRYGLALLAVIRFFLCPSTQERATIQFHGLAAELSWGKARPIPPDLAAAIQNGATRNLYLGNLPESTTVEHIMSHFGGFGQIESVRVMRNHGCGYVNFCSVESAINARERYAGQRVGQIVPEAVGAESEKELQVTFTSAQQNCRRRVAPVGKGAGRGAMDFSRGRGFDGRGRGGGLQRSRSVYVGNLPQGVTLSDLSELALPYGPLESLRWMGQAYAFLNFTDELTAANFWEAGQPGRAGVFLRGVRLLLNWAKAPPLDSAVSLSLVSLLSQN